MRQPKLMLGPILYDWPREPIQAFYAAIAESPIDGVYLGEAVCGKRRTLTLEEWLEVAEQLTAAGKQVVLTSLALIEADSELNRLRRIARQANYLIEANDLAAVQLRAGRPLVAGPGLNLYNERTLDHLARHGMVRWVPPVELGHEDIAELHARRPAGVETELMVYGRMPLAHSARCFTARAHDRSKDECQEACSGYPDGLTLATQEGMPFLTLNGVQVQSARTLNLLGEIEAIRSLGIDALRINPQAAGTETVIDVFYRCLIGELSPAEGSAQLTAHVPIGTCNGYWHGDAGLVQRAAVLS